VRELCSDLNSLSSKNSIVFSLSDSAISKHHQTKNQRRMAAAV